MKKLRAAMLAILPLAFLPAAAAAPDPLAISNVGATATPEAITVSWLTNLPATSRAEWGTSETNLPYNKADDSYVTNHTLTLTGLTPGTVYYIVITSVGQQGETARYTVSQPKPPAAAPVQAPAPRPAPAPSSDDGWHFGFTPYLWFPGIHGTTGTAAHPVSVRTSAADVLSHFNIGLMGAFDARKKRFVYLGDLMWIKLGNDKAGYYNDVNVSADAKLYDLLFSQAIGYRVVDAPKLKIDGVGGFRLWYSSTDLKVTANYVDRSLNATETWVDPIVGSRILMPLGEKAQMTIYGDVGGWNTGSKLEYQIVGTMGYRIKPKLLMEAGWRYLYVDYETGLPNQGTFLYQLTQTGPIIGLRIGK